MANPYIGAGFDTSIGTRQKAGQTQVEFYNTQNPQQLAFANPGELANFAKTVSGRSDINEGNVFDVLKQGFTPRAAAINQITDQLNQQQQQTFSQQTAPKRASSGLSDSIALENNTINDALAEFNTLKTKLSSLQNPNYEQAYGAARTQAGLPQIETDVANSQKAIRELPYVNRQNFGNAGVTTEGQLGADTAQKGIPLEIQQANALDRLKLAESFVQNSLKFKEMDANSERASLQEAINLVGDTINLSRTRISDLSAKEQEQQKREEIGQAFAFENRITAPFYDIGGTVYRTSDRMPAHNKEEYIEMGGTGDFSDVQKISPKVNPVEVNPGNTLIDPTTGKVIYQAPAKSTGGSSGGSAGGGGSTNSAISQLSNPTDSRVLEIIAANPGEWGHAADQIDAEFGQGTATRYDSWLKQVYQDGKSVESVQSSRANLSSLAQAVVNNPKLLESLTPTRKGEVISELTQKGMGDSLANTGKKVLPSGGVEKIAQSKNALDLLTELKQKVTQNIQYIGPLSGIQKYNPWSDARQVQADIDKTRQVVGKALEGGVLRKEDEEKYKRILATIFDTPELAVYKINGLLESVQNDIENFTSTAGQAGYNTSGFNSTKPSLSSFIK